MFQFSKMIHSKSGKYVISVILGLGLASLFRQMCKDKNCIVFFAPPFEEIKDKVYKQDEKCYTFHSTTTKCDATKKMVKIENKDPV